MIVDRAAASLGFDPLDRANGGLTDWPGGAAQYVYGAYFHQYLADRFGPESIAKLAEETSGRVPYFGAPAFRKVFNRSLGELWEDFAANARAHALPEDGAPARLTHHGFSVGAPTFGQNGHIFYSIANPHGFPALMELTGDSSIPREVTTRYFGSLIGEGNGHLVFDQLELVHNLRRLTHLARAADPDLSHDGKTVVCTIQRADRRALGTFELSAAGFAAPSILLSEEGIEYSSPRWSADGRSIAVERRRLGGASEIVVVDVATRRARPIVSSRDGRNVTPNWLSPTTVLFASDRGGQPFNIYAVDVASAVVRRLNGTGPSAQSPAVSPDGKTIVFVGYTTDGYDLFSVPLAAASWTTVDSISVSGAPKPADPSSHVAPNTSPDTVYRPWRTLVPQFWMPVVESDAGELAAGAETDASDALGRHRYGATVAWASSRARPDWSIVYAYDRWWPTFFVTMSDDTDPWRGGEIRTREVNAGALFNVARVRWSQTVLTAINASEDGFACQTCDDPAPRSVRRGAIRTGWSFINAKSYGYSISRESGTALRLTFENAPEALGSDTATSALTVDTRAYAQLGPRHAALAVRAAAASAWGD